ncbi:hypothetical protein NY2A_b574R [Paramecium bursaria Chlorella virus NY2A]|uniref:Uncharacterized protein b574R n=1 Tax=Paramecium bursaria Chlorella virus NY2A TaxID=46021 RepID=A7IX99_PBCVN|nr:hypothetical protein NY2A_b574R [Paramecium bursaria Chlorella virus NY2A]ABT14973.1 hypothetical protein NY2A_b574R [Paramecium bursaria Chlorella virus NY2A]
MTSSRADFTFGSAIVVFMLLMKSANITNNILFFKKYLHNLNEHENSYTHRRCMYSTRSIHIFIYEHEKKRNMVFENA